MNIDNKFGTVGCAWRWIKKVTFAAGTSTGGMTNKNTAASAMRR